MRPAAPPPHRLSAIRALLTGALSLLISACGGGGGGSSTPPPTPSSITPTLTSITVVPTAPTLIVGASVSIQATGRFSDGTTVTPYAVTWTSSAPGTASVSASGLVSGVAAGTATITATQGAIQGSVVVTVNASSSALTSITLAPSAPTLIVGASVDIQATGHFSDGTTVTPYSVTWTSSAPGTASVSSSGLVSGVAAGTATITATQGTIQGSTVVTVNASPAVLTSITLNPSGPTLNVGASVDIQATGHFSDGTTVTPYDSSVTWTSSAPGTASVSASGLVDGVAAGTATITATQGAIQGSAAVTVNASSAVLTSITLDPAAGVTLNVGQTADFTATANWSNGTSTTPYDSSVTWTTNLPGVATVNSAGVVTAVAAGSAILTATASGLNTTATITVSPSSPTLTSITLNPAAGVTLNVGQTADFTATANWSNGTSTTPYDANVTWSTNTPSVATVNSAGVVTAVGAGSATLTAAANGRSTTAAITVNASSPTLTSITLNPISSALNIGQTVDIAATGHLSNGTTDSPYDTRAIWTSSAPAVATVDSIGVVTALSAGTATITASASGVSGTASITVNAGPTVTSISLDPASATLNIGQTVDITSTVNWSNGTSTVPYDSHLTWTSSAPSVATVNAGGVVTGVAAGAATITASLNGVSRTAAITVSAAAPTLTSITLNPTSATGSAGQTMDITATGRFSDGSIVTPYDAQVTWTSNAPTVATVNAAGLVTAVWRGTALITATKGAISATCTVTVNQPFDAALVGRWLFVGVPNPIDYSNAATQYTFNSDGTFTYFLTKDFGVTSGPYGKVEAVHVGSFSNTSNQIILNCTSHVTNYYGVDKHTLVYQAPMTPGIHVHTDVSFPFVNVLRSRNDGFDFMNTGLLDHTKQ